MKTAQNISISLARDFLSSIVVFLVALPLCLGIALACGLPPAKGLLTGIIGGIVIGFLSGSKLQVSGPAAGLTAVVTELVAGHGVETFAVIVLGAGALQLIGGLIGLGRLFLMVPQAVVQGMLSAIGAILVLSQLHVMIDGTPGASPMANLVGLQDAVQKIFQSGQALQALVVSALALSVMIGWKALKLNKLTRIPEALPAIGLATAAVFFWQLGVKRVDLPNSLADMVSFINLGQTGLLVSGSLIAGIFTLAIVASAETMLSAASVEQMSGQPNDYDRELRAQGIGNIICALLGGLPTTAVIVRSKANMDAGATSKWSCILHGVWLLVAVAFLPFVLEMIPTASLAALLVLTGWKLMDFKHVLAMRKHGWGELAIFVVTFGTILATDLLTGVAAGFVAALIRLLLKLTHLDVKVEQQPTGVTVSLTGVGTYLSKPKLARMLASIPPASQVEIRTGDLRQCDHCFQQYIAAWAERHRGTGGSVSCTGELLDAPPTQAQCGN